MRPSIKPAVLDYPALPVPSTIIEYSVYVFHHAINKKNGKNDWERKDVTPSREQAFRLAESLNQGGHYKSVEIQKKFYDFKNNRSLSMTIKTYHVANETRPDTQTLIAFVLVLGTLFLMLGYAFTKGLIF